MDIVEVRSGNQAREGEIVERKQLENQLRASEAKMRGIVDSLSIGILLISPEMKILELNRQMRHWFPDLLPEQHPVCYQALNCPQQDKQSKDCPTRLTFQDGKAHEATIQLTKPDGMRSYRILSSPIRDEAGRVKTVIEVIEDVTDRLSLEHQLLQSQKLEAIGQLAGGVAHDFNNMLSVIIGYSEELMDSLHPTDPQWEMVNEILTAGQRSAALTRQLLAFSRKQSLQTEVLDINETIEQLEKMLKRLIGEHIELTTVLSRDLGLVKADPQQLEQVIMNLAINARDAMPRGGRLTIETANVELDEAHGPRHAEVSAEKHVLLSISDTGSGMNEKTRKKIFDPFFTTKEKGKGSGLGLSTVYGIVKQLGGNIWVTSEVGKGTVFKIFLPRTRIQPAAQRFEAESSPLPAGEVCILLVEDQPNLRRLAERMLSDLGYQVTAVSNGAEAMAMFDEKVIRPELVITDVVMPEMSGPDLADRLRKIQPGIKILYMSGYTGNMIVHQGIVDPGTPILQKPFSKRNLAAKIAMLLRTESRN